MPVPKGYQFPDRQVYSDEQLIEEAPKIGMRAFARKYAVTIQSVNRRRRAIEQRIGGAVTPLTRGGHWQQLDRHPAVIQLGLQDGIVLVGSDAHYWPGVVPTAHNAFIEFCREYKPKAVVMNGDEMDFPTISRFAPIGWENRPKISEEIDNAKEMLAEIEAVTKGARRTSPLGNHTARFETRLATVAPEYAKVHGVHLKDHFPNWEPCWATFVNDELVIKHRIKSGVHAPYNDTLTAGRSTATGHRHDQKVTPFSDYNGTRWGTDCGMMADPYSPQFYNYTEMSPLNWRSGFGMFTFKKGKLLMPELIWVSGPGTVQFRGREWNV